MEPPLIRLEMTRVYCEHPFAHVLTHKSLLYSLYRLELTLLIGLATNCLGRCEVLAQISAPQSRLSWEKAIKLRLPCLVTVWLLESNSGLSASVTNFADSVQYIYLPNRG